MTAPREQPGAGMDVRDSPFRLTIEVFTEDDTRRLGRAISEVLRPGVVIGLVGPLGAGKTLLVRAIAEAQGVDPAEISSPTFVLIHEYAGNLPIYHFDAYRLASCRAFEDLGVADYFGGAGVCLVEWAERVRDLLPLDCWMITLVPTGPSSRVVRLELPHSAQAAAEKLARHIA
jgi:tRNA threonylcarbamoyladenosine biosynthesis protein TsaE